MSRTFFWLGVAVLAAQQFDRTTGTLALMIALVIAFALGVRDQRRGAAAAPVIRRMPTRHEQTRWHPVTGVGVSLRHGLHPFAFLGFRRWWR